MKLYKEDEVFKLFKAYYYRYCLYSPNKLKHKREELYERMKYANDYYGIQVDTLSILEYMNKIYDEHKDKFKSTFWFEVFIRKTRLPEYIIARNLKTNLK